MRFCLMHLDDDGRSEELAVTVPGAERAVMMVELHSLPAFLPLLKDATADLPEQRCAACAAELPGLRRAEGHAG